MSKELEQFAWLLLVLSIKSTKIDVKTSIDVYVDSFEGTRYNEFRFTHNHSFKF
jgi:hypothetical protein